MGTPVDGSFVYKLCNESIDKAEKLSSSVFKQRCLDFLNTLKLTSEKRLKIIIILKVKIFIDNNLHRFCKICTSQEETVCIRDAELEHSQASSTLWY